LFCFHRPLGGRVRRPGSWVVVVVAVRRVVVVVSKGVLESNVHFNIESCDSEFEMNFVVVWSTLIMWFVEGGRKWLRAKFLQSY
jgi:hypothetical protein